MFGATDAVLASSFSEWKPDAWYAAETLSATICTSGLVMWRKVPLALRNVLRLNCAKTLTDNRDH